MEAVLWAYFLVGPLAAVIIGALIVHWILQERQR